MRSPLPRHPAIVLTSVTALSLSLLMTACSANPAPSPLAIRTDSTSSAGTSSATPTSTPTSSSAGSSAGSSAPATNRVAVGGAALGASSPAPAPPGASQSDPAHAWPGDWTETGPVKPQWDDRTITATYKVSGGVTLRDGWFRGVDSWSTRNGQVDTVTSQSSFAVKGQSPAFMYRHRIYDNGQPTDFWMGTKFGSPDSGSNQWNCFIYRGDPASGGKWEPLSPYVCDWSNVRGWNPEPVLEVKKATVVTDADDAKDALTKYCNGADAASRCRYFNTGTSERMGDQRVVGSYLDTGPTGAVDVIEFEHKESTETSIGVELTLGAEIAHIFSVEVTSKFDKSWALEHTFKQSVHFEAEPNHLAWTEFRPHLAVATGTWVVDTGSGTLVVPAVSSESPIEDGSEIIVLQCPEAKFDKVHMQCEERPWEKVVQP